MVEFDCIFKYNLIMQNYTQENITALKERAKQIRLLATDLDGTLLNRKHQLSDVNLAALKTCADKGIIICAATGRARSSLPDKVAGFEGMKYLITANGAKIYNAKTNEILSKTYLSEEAIEYVHPFLSDKEILCEYFWDGDPHVEESRFHNAEGYGIPFWFSDYFFASRIPTYNFESEVKTHAHEIENVTFVFDTDEKKERVASFLLKRAELYELTSAFAFHYEIGGKGVSKAAALDFIIRREGVHRNEIICFGDNYNDAAMLKYAGISVAPANAVPEVQEISDFVTDNNDNDGFAKALEVLGII